jgi:amino-acid N-acetyltransferase
MYEGTRDATINDVGGIEQLLRPLVELDIVVNRPREQLLQDLQAYTVVERDGSIIACAALFPYAEDESGEVAAFAVSPECQGHGQGDSLLGNCL